MKTQARTLNRRHSFFQSRRALAGMTLVEVSISMVLFALMTSSLGGSLIYLRRMAERGVSQAISQAIAEGMIEQIQNMSYTVLTDQTPPIAPVALQFIYITSDNYVKVQNTSVAWDDPTPNPSDPANPIPPTGAMVEVGERVNPSDAGDVVGATVRGVVMDVEYRNSVTQAVIRPKRYMKMWVNLQRIPNVGKENIAIVLTYKWAVPDQHTLTGDPVYMSSQIRTVKSKAPSY